MKKLDLAKLMDVRNSRGELVRLSPKFISRFNTSSNQWLFDILRQEKPIVSLRGWSIYTLNDGFVAANHGEHDAAPATVYEDSLDSLVEGILQHIGI